MYGIIWDDVDDLHDVDDMRWSKRHSCGAEMNTIYNLWSGDLQCINICTMYIFKYINIHTYLYIHIYIYYQNEIKWVQAKRSIFAARHQSETGPASRSLYGQSVWTWRCGGSWSRQTLKECYISFSEYWNMLK